MQVELSGLLILCLEQAGPTRTQGTIPLENSGPSLCAETLLGATPLEFLVG